jgi:hypothetical protein
MPSLKGTGFKKSNFLKTVFRPGHPAKTREVGAPICGTPADIALVEQDNLWYFAQC